MISKIITAAIRDVPNFPKEGILFKDITPIFAQPKLCKQITDELLKQCKTLKIDVVVGVESRGFFFGFHLAQALQVPFVPIRKAGKLPCLSVSEAYALEYGTAKLEMHIDAISAGQNVLIHDDLLATGGTAAAVARLIKRQGGNISAFAFLVELGFLNGAEVVKAECEKIISLVKY